MMENNIEKLRQLARSPMAGKPQENGMAAANIETVKAERIGRSVALNCASASVEAFGMVFASVDACKGYSADKIQNLLRSIKASEYADNLKLLGFEDDMKEEIPF